MTNYALRYIHTTQMFRKLDDLITEIKRALALTPTERLELYGTDGLKLLIDRYLEESKNINQLMIEVKSHGE